MPQNEKTRIGFVGVGGMGQCAHLRNYPAIEDCEVVAIAELRPAMARRVAQRYDVPAVYGSWEDMVARENLDAIVASQPFTRHGILVPELLKTGKPVFTEKPLAGSVEVGRRILAAVEASGTFLMVGYHKRSDPASMYALAEVERLRESGELGKVKYVRSLMPAGDWIAEGFRDLIRGDDGEAPKLGFDPPASDMDEETYGAYTGFVNYNIHQVNLLRYFLGESYQVKYADPSGVLFAGESESGVACTIEMSPYATTVDWQESVFIAFERGYVKVELPAPVASNRPGQVEILRDPGDGATPETVVPTLPWIHAMRQQATNYVAAVRGEREPMCGAADALKDLEVAREYIRLHRGQ